MSRKHYIAIAEALNWISNLTERRRVAEIIADMAKADNSNFDRVRFYAACGL